jgi:hypothetical protein
LFSADVLQRIGEPLPPAFHDAMLSPDGTTVAGHYTDAEARGERIALIPVAGGKVSRLKAVPPSAMWAPDSRSLLYTATQAGVSNLVRYAIAAGTVTPLTKFGSEQIFSYAIAPDQGQLAIVRGRVSSDVVLISAGPR